MTEKYPVEQVIEDAARLGFDGVEINLDTGNFPGHPYPEIEKLAPHAISTTAASRRRCAEEPSGASFGVLSRRRKYLTRLLVRRTID